MKWVAIIKRKESEENFKSSFTEQESAKEYAKKITSNKNFFKDESHYEVEIYQDNSEEIENSYNEMVEEIYDAMEKVFETRSDSSASAYAATYEAMAKRPENYVDKELGFLSAEQVKTYADLKIKEADEFAVFRMKRIAKFSKLKEELND